MQAADRFMKIKKIKIRIALYFTAGFLFIILMIAGISTYIFSTTLMSQLRKNIKQNVKMIDFELDSGVNRVYEIQRQIVNNSRLNNLMKIVAEYDGGSDSSVKEISSIMRDFSYKTIYTNSILMFNKKGVVLDPFYHIEPYSKIIRENNDFRSFLKSEKFKQFSPPSTFPMNSSFMKINSRKNITYYVQYLDNRNFRKLGYLAINIRNNFLFGNIEKHYSGIFDEIFIYDKQGNTIFSMTDRSFYHFRESSKYLVYEKSVSAYPEWKIAVAISTSSLFSVVQKVLVSIYIITIVGIIMAILIGFYISSSVSTPIYEINSAINKFQITSKWPEPLTCRTEDEMNYLIKGINGLFISMQELVDQIYEEQEEKKSAEVKAVELRLQLLQSQINPHFIHNTLNAVECIALELGADDICSMINSLNLLFRNSMAIDRIYNTVEEGICAVEAFIIIMKFRYGDSFEYNISVDDSIKDCLVPKLLVQPLVENALFHGLQPKEGQGRLDIKVTECRDLIKIEVSDNGVGMDVENYEALLGRYRRGLTSIGINNIVERLKYCYNDDGKIDFQSKKGEGTTITMMLPRKPFRE